MGRTRDHRRKRNKKRKQDLDTRKTNSYRTKAGLKYDETEAVLSSHIRRALAFTIDQFLFLLFFFCYFLVVALLFGEVPRFASSVIIPAMIYGVGYVAYSIGTKGATIGCRRLGIIVIDESGKGLIGFQRAFNRWFLLSGIVIVATGIFSTMIAQEYQMYVGMVSGSLSMVMYFPAFWDSKRQGFHDRICGSVVINALKEPPRKQKVS